MKNILETIINSMSEEERMKAIYVDSLTGLWNRSALESTPDKKYFAIIDVDSLKWVNDNQGHRAGDDLLVQTASILQSLFGDEAFRLSGDEFVVRSDTMDSLLRLEKFNTKYSFGIGYTLTQADKSLTFDKNSREQRGVRASRGEQPPFFQTTKG